MANEIYRKMELTNEADVPAIKVAQGTNGFDLVFDLVDYYAYSGTTTEIYLEKPSGALIYNSGTIEDHRKLRFAMTTQMTAETGIVKGQIQIVNLYEAVINSFQFLMIVEETIIDNSAIESTDEFTALETAIAAANNFLPKVDVVDTGSSSRPIYFNSNAKAQGVSEVGVLYGGTGADNGPDACDNLGAVRKFSVNYAASTENEPLYMDSSYVWHKTSLPAAFQRKSLPSGATNVYDLTAHGIYYVSDSTISGLPGTGDYVLLVNSDPNTLKTVYFCKKLAGGVQKRFWIAYGTGTSASFSGWELYTSQPVQSASFSGTTTENGRIQLGSGNLNVIGIELTNNTQNVFIEIETNVTGQGTHRIYAHFKSQTGANVASTAFSGTYYYL